MMRLKQPKYAERRLAMVFGWEASKTILKVIEEDQTEEIFGSCAKLIKQVAEGEIVELDNVDSPIGRD